MGRPKVVIIPVNQSKLLSVREIALIVKIEFEKVAG
jgi:hypothetical protein